ncbi:ABC transporter permease [Lyngbya confervoides BDU141951]|uniref:ABC transporter permease n=2 Tax=Lyngbya TaxID=28073 RepID=A0ABD4TAD5_9CYAN|nr:ABC transporter permease [Lyngbya confervoides]MCM1985364.1 ABC transporter permease [Lyngbya confervoides BDU141951]
MKRNGLAPTVFWRMTEDIPRSLQGLLVVLSVAVPLALWWGLAATGWIHPKFLPSPIDVAQALTSLFAEGVLWTDAWASIYRVSLGFLLAAVISVPLGIMMGTFSSVRALSEPIIGIVRYMPAPAFIPLLIIYLGLDEAPKIALIFIGTVFFNVLMIMDAVKFVPKELLETGFTLGGSRRQVLMQVITPYVVPNILDAFRVNMAASWNLVVVAELVAANEGLGKRIELAQRFFRTDEIFACLIVLGLIGFAIDLGFRVLLRTTCRWAVE